MTGYGRADEERDGWMVTAEIRSVNHRSLDIRITAPAGLSGIELAARERIKALCARGRVECRVALESPGVRLVSEATLEQADELYQALLTVRDHLGLAPEVGLRDLFAAGFELGTTEAEPAADLEVVALDAIERALQVLIDAREREGAALQQEFLDRLLRTLDLIEQIAGLSDVTSREFQTRSLERLEEILSQIGAGSVFEDDRFKKELVNSLDRSDITEEIVRARTHVTTLRQLFEDSSHEQVSLGKRVDFFLQELIREANTMASKSQSADLTSHVIGVKVEIERMREQAQNIE